MAMHGQGNGVGGRMRDVYVTESSYGGITLYTVMVV